MAINFLLVALPTSRAVIPMYILININVISDGFLHLTFFKNICFFNNTVIIDGATLLPYLSVSTSLLATNLAGINNRIALFLSENFDCCILKFKGSQGELIKYLKYSKSNSLPRLTVSFFVSYLD